ncbi:respiratory nitrate reductase subunit gamma [Asticcacaulis sp. W401b]|jgi:nitrate reductase gamma subunit|uniref:respiratory nitrate reductase subunit gamma n=1 Tax=Asticcacaulis sp. W401b TaxID=3388666 RepID=UPI003970BC11
MTNTYYTFFFGIYPYIALSILAIGSLVRYDREPYTWKASSSLLLADKGLRLGNILFHIGVLFIFGGHLVGLLTPHWVYAPFITAEQKQMVAIAAGGAAGIVGFAGLTILVFRRLFVARIRHTSSAADILILLLLWVQIVLGLTTIPFSLGHHDATIMLRLCDWAQSIFTFQPQAASYIVDLAWPYQVHIILGLTLFVLFPFTRLVHMLSVPVKYIGRPYQIVRSRMAKR